MRVKYFIIKGKSELSSIYVRFWDSNRIDQKTRTGFVVKHDDWSPGREKVKNKVGVKDKDAINQSLEALKYFLVQQYNIDLSKKKSPNNGWLKKTVVSFFGITDVDNPHETYYTTWINKYMENAHLKLHKGKPIKKKTLQHYKTALNKLEAFEKHYNRRLKLWDIDLSFYRDFLHYLRTEENLNDNTIGRYIANIKMWCKIIDIEGLPISQEYRHSQFMVVKSVTKDIFLSEDEIVKVFNHDFSNSDRLDNTRDLFIIGLRTGLRVSDFLRLKKLNIEDDFIQVETEKTGEQVIIPMHENIKYILKKRKGELPHPISDQKFNLYIKEVCKEVGINKKVQGAKMTTKTVKGQNVTRKESGTFHKYELVSSHTCRRSFATNLYGKLPNLTIMAITGHRKESQFLLYIKQTKVEHARELKRFWESNSKQNG